MIQESKLNISYNVFFAVDVLQLFCGLQSSIGTSIINNNHLKIVATKARTHTQYQVNVLRLPVLTTNE